MAYSLPSIADVPSLDAEARAQILASLFEPCTALNTLSVESLGTNTFESYPSLIASVRQQLHDLNASNLASDQEWLLKILAAHPRLGAKKVDSASSQSEQGSLGGEEEKRELLRLNEGYEERFPGMIYVVFVAGRSREVIMKDMEMRIARGDFEQEKLGAINAMADIANDRATKLA